jgi:hypothetical protein
MSNDEINNDDAKTKRILCINAIKGRTCNYGTKCMYAHSLNDQKIDTIRHKVYTILKNDNNLKNINLIKDKKLFAILGQLTKVCYQCSKNDCHGGYNCRNGAINQKYRICHDDLMYGICRRHNCGGIHLTSRGLIPYCSQTDNQKKQLNSDTLTDECSLESVGSKSSVPTIRETEHIDKILKTINKKDKCCIKSKRTLNKNSNGVLLTDNFLVNHYNNIKKNKKIVSFDNTSSTDEEDVIIKMKNYMEKENSEDSLEESIFDI